MTKRAFAIAILASTALAGGILAAPAAAQVAPPAPVRSSIDDNGVDLFLGTMNVDSPVLSAGGSGPQGLAYRKFNHGGGWGDNLVATLSVSGSTVYVAFGTTTDQFTQSGTTYTSTEGDGATLSLSGTVYTWTAADGTVAHFNKIYVGTYPYGAVTAIVTDVSRPNGEALTYSYDSAAYCSASKPGGAGDICTRHSTAYRITSIANNSKYKLSFNYDNWDGLMFDPNEVPDNATFSNWGDITGVSMTNTAITGANVRSQTFTPSFSGGSSYDTIIDSMGRGTAYRLTGAAVAGITLPGSASEDVTVTYASGKVSAVTNAIGTTTYASSDASGVRTVTVTNPAGKVTTYTFDIALQRMTSMTDATARKTSWDYDTSGRLTKVTAPELNYTHHTYDTRGNVTQTDTVDKTGMLTISTYAGYDSTCSNTATCNQPNTTTDARGNVTNYTYNSDGTLLTVTAPAPTTGATRPSTSYSYTAVNGVSLTSGTSTCRTTASCAGTSDELKITVTYNANGLPATSTTAAGDASLSSTTTVGYDDVGNAISVDGPMSGSDDAVNRRYDADREKVGAIGPDPDGAGPLVRAAVKTTYDLQGHVSEAELGTVAGTSDSDWAAFSSQQQLIATRDAAGRKTRVVSTAGGTIYGVTEYSYDSAGRPDCVAVRMNASYWGTATAACVAETAGSQGPDRIARTTYDDAGRPLTTTSAYSTSAASTDTTLTYTSNGKLATATDAEGNKTAYSYDEFDRLSITTYPSVTKGSGTTNSSDYEQLSYDAGSNVTSRRLRDGTSIGYTYDALNRVTAKNLPGTDPDIAYTYDLTGKPLTIATSAQTVTLGYDALGRLSSDAQPYGTMAYQYDAAGRRTRVTWPDAFYVTYGYDVAGNMTTVKQSGTTTLATYAYDSLGRRTSLTRGNGVVSSYSYDNASRLTGLGIDLTGTSSDLSIGLSYNNAGQIVGRTASNDAYGWAGSTDVNRPYTSNGLNQFTASGSTSLGYDARGNLTSSGSDSYTYDSENRLTGRNNGTSIAYDPAGRLDAQTYAGTTVEFLSDGDAITATALSGALLRRWILGAGGEPLVDAYAPTGAPVYAAADERGSVVSRSDSTGASSFINSYDEYGIPAANQGLYQYTGQVLFPQLGLYYYKARMYSPTLGRFMQTDPIGYGDGMNWYNYVGSDPVNSNDPSGLKAKHYDWKKLFGATLNGELKGSIAGGIGGAVTGGVVGSGAGGIGAAPGAVAGGLFGAAAGAAAGAAQGFLDELQAQNGGSLFSW